MSSVGFKKISSDADVLKVSELAHEIWRDHYRSMLSPEQIEYMLEKMQSPGPIRDQINSGYEYRFVRNLGRTIGYVAYKPNEPERGRMFVSKIYLLREERGRGYFRSIMKLLDQEASSSGQESMWLTVNRDNPAVGPYKALGFRTFRIQDVDIGGGFEMNDYVMERAVGN